MDDELLGMAEYKRFLVSTDEYDLAVEQDLLESDGLLSNSQGGIRILKPEEWVSFVDRDVLTAIDFRISAFQLKK